MTRLSFKSSSHRQEIPSTQPRSRRVLIVDDDPAISSGLAKTLRRPPHAYVVEIARDGFDAIGKFDSFKPDLILLDLVMPKMGGLELCSRIRRQYGRDDVKIIVLTGFPGRGNAEASLLLDADACLSKPQPVKKLLAHINDVLEL